MTKMLLLACLLFPCLTLAQAAPDSGIEGTIVIGPAQGGPTRPGAANTRPLSTTEFVVRQGDEVVATFRTDTDGRFRVSLSPGHYSVTKKEKGVMGSFGPFEVDVAAGKMKSVQWECDSGIR